MNTLDAMLASTSPLPDKSTPDPTAMMSTSPPPTPKPCPGSPADLPPSINTNDDLAAELERTPRATASDTAGTVPGTVDQQRKSKLSTASSTSTQYSLTPTKAQPFPSSSASAYQSEHDDGAFSKVQMRRRRSSRRSGNTTTTSASSSDHRQYNLYGGVDVDVDNEFGAEDFFGSSIPVELCQASSPRVSEFLHELADAMLLIKPTLEAFVDEGVSESDPMVPHLVAAESDVAMYSLFHDDHDDWTTAEIVELLDNAHQLVLASLAFPDLCAAVILPQLRNAFPLPAFAQALLDWTLPRRTSISPTTSESTTATDPRYDLTNPLLLTFLVGRGNKPADLMLVGELAATLARLVTLDDPNSSASLTLQEARYTHPWTAPYPAHALHLFRSVLRLSAGHNPLCAASLLSGLFEAISTTRDMATLFTSLFPAIDTDYEPVHGDTALMLRQLHLLPLSPITDFAYFLTCLIQHYPAHTGAELAIFFGLSTPSPLTSHLDPNPNVAMYKHNALTHGSAPYHVRLAFAHIGHVHRAPAALSMFRFAYENPLSAGFAYRMSGRVNEWRVVDAPAAAMAKVAKVVEAWGGDEDGFLDYMFEKLAELEFGFVEANDMDEAENAAGGVGGGGTDDDEEGEGVDLAIRGVGVRSPGLGDMELGDEEEDEWFTRASAMLNAMDNGGGELDGFEGVAAEPHVDDDFVRMCLEQIEAADGDLEAVDIEGLVDELLVRSRVPVGAAAGETSRPSDEQRK